MNKSCLKTAYHLPHALYHFNCNLMVELLLERTLYRLAIGVKHLVELF